jgi:CBS domain-containing protein
MPKLREIMTPEVQVISPNATAADASSKMEDLNVGAIPVCDGKNLVGMVTDRDLVLRVMAQRRDPSTTTVRDTMTPDVYFCYDDEEAEIAADLMAQQQIRRLPILSRTKQLVGIVSLGDLALDGVDSQSCGEVLKEVSDPV